MPTEDTRKECNCNFRPNEHCVAHQANEVRIDTLFAMRDHDKVESEQSRQSLREEIKDLKVTVRELSEKLLSYIEESHQWRMKMEKPMECLYSMKRIAYPVAGTLMAAIILWSIAELYKTVKHVEMEGHAPSKQSQTVK